MISERTRDKMGAARRKGKWVGGSIVLGYDLLAGGGALAINPAEAERVREIFRLYLELGSLMPLVQELERRDWRLKTRTTLKGREVGGSRFNKTKLHNLLTNAIYAGRVAYDGKLYDGEHERIVDDATWNQVQEQLNRNGRRGGRNAPNKYGALLKGMVRCDSCGVGMTHTYVRKSNNTLYRYYVCINAHQRGWNKCETRSVSAPLLEGAVVEHIRGFAQRPQMLPDLKRQIEGGAEAKPHASRIEQSVDPGELQQALAKFDPLWEHLNTAEQERFIRALVTEVRYNGRTQTVTLGFRSQAIKDSCSRAAAVIEVRQ